MNPLQHVPQAEDFFQTRRQFLNRFGMGFGAMSLASLLGDSFASRAAADVSLSPLAPRQSHFPGKARRVIHLFAQGGPTHLDTWDYKPGLAKYEGQEVKEIGGVPLPPQYGFRKMGQSGVEVSEIFPKIGEMIDEVAVINSMHTDIPSHEFATVMMNTGSGRIVKPSMGSWVLYGLGSENQNLPGFIALGGGLGGSQNWRSAFLPGAFQGTLVRNVSTDIEKIIENIKNHYITAGQQRDQIELFRKLSELHNENLKRESELEARIQSFELALQMQTEATEAFDIANEPESVKELYGDSAQGRQLLVARRLLERGVRFVQSWHNGWDHHTGVKSAVARKAGECDQPIGALLKDLKQRGMLEDTLVIWTGEFGRTPRHDRNGRGEPGRDHHNRGFSAWIAGAGVKGGQRYGATDEFGYNAVENKVHVHDLHATALHLLGFNHEHLTYRYNGRDFRLTDVYGNVAQGLLS